MAKQNLEVRKDLYKGFTEDDLKKMSLEEYMKILPSRNRRALKRLDLNPTLKKLIARVRKGVKNGKTKFKTHCRDAVILPEWLGLTFSVYNGKTWKDVKITVNHLGHRLGEFAHTTGRVTHGGPGVGATRGSKFVPLK